MGENIRKESSNVLLIGKSGTGKSSLVNYMFGRELQKVGVGAPVTKMEIKKFPYQYDEHFEINIYDTWGLEPGTEKADAWKMRIFDEINQHDQGSVSSWFNTIIFCLNAKASRIEDYELDIMEQLLLEKNHLTIAFTHCTSREDKDGIILRESIKEELLRRGIDSFDDRNFVFVSNVRKKLIGGSVEQFGREEIFTSIIRNIWASLKSKVPYQARKQFEKQYLLKREEILKKPDKLKWFVPFRKLSSINRLEKEINSNCEAFVSELVKDVNSRYTDAIRYYSELSKKYAMIGFSLNQEDYETSEEIHFDAKKTVKDQVEADMKQLKERIIFLDSFLKDKKVEANIRDTIINFRILLRDGKKIREDLKEELERYMDSVKAVLDEHLNRIEEKLNELEIDDLYMFQTT